MIRVIMRSRLPVVAAATVVAALFAIPGSLAQSQAPVGALLSEKSAGETFKNVHVLGKLPASQLIPAMRYMTTALGVGCDFCHNTRDFPSDEKQQKRTARKMMLMMFAINSNSFNGKREVTCYTCHRGSSKPITTPSLPDGAAPAQPLAAGSSAANQPVPQKSGEAASTPSSSSQVAASQPSPNWPTAQDIVAKYGQAVGGEKAIAKISTLVESGTLLIAPQEIHADVEIDRKVPDKEVTVTHMQHGAMFHGFDGEIAWVQRGREPEQVRGDDMSAEMRWAALYPGADIFTYYTMLRVVGVEKIEGQDAYRIEAWPAAGARETLFFDKDTGFLVRVTSIIPSALGSLPKEIDYSDFHEVSGIKVPATIRIVEVNGTSTYQFQTIEANKPLANSRFAMPPPKPEEKR